MKHFAALAVLLFSLSAFANNYKAECKNAVVTVDEIVKNSHIKGHVTGLPGEAYEKLKVVFYVKTNRWYVHPYTWHENQEEGYSYSNLNPNGEFWVRTVSRDVPAQKMAVVVVPKNYKITSQKWWLKPLFGIFGGVLKGQCNHVIVPGNGDFFH